MKKICEQWYHWGGDIVLYLLPKKRVKGDLSSLKTPMVIFDFDGTICDSFPILCSLLNELSSVYKFRSITEDMVPQLRNMPTKKNLQTLHIPLWKFPFIIKNCNIVCKRIS